MMPSCDQIGVPIHFHSSTTSGSASLMSLRILLRVSPRQSPSSAILFEMSSDADWPWLAPDFFTFSSWKFQIYFIRWDVEHEPAIGAQTTDLLVRTNAAESSGAVQRPRHVSCVGAGCEARPQPRYGFLSTLKPPVFMSKCNLNGSPSGLLKSTWCSKTVRASWMRNLR